MPLTIPDPILAALLSRRSSDELLFLFIISHPNLETVRLVRNSVSVVSRGDTYTAAPIQMALATDDEDFPVIDITIPNVDRAIGRSLMTIRPPLHVTIEAVMDSDKDNPFRSWRHFELTNVNFNAIAVTGRLSYERLNSEPHPNIRVTPGRFPAFFR